MASAEPTERAGGPSQTLGPPEPEVYETFPPKRAQVVFLEDGDSESDHGAELDADAMDRRPMDPSVAAERFQAALAARAAAAVPEYLKDETDRWSDTRALPEGPAARLARLQGEAAELERELADEAASQAVPSAARLRSHARRLCDYLDSAAAASRNVMAPADLAALVSSLSLSPADEAAASESEGPTPPADARQAATALSALEARLASMEQRLGVNVMSAAEPLTQVVSRLEQQLPLLTQPRHLDAMAARAKVVVTELERVREQRAASAPDAALPLDEWYALQARIAPLEPLAPALLERLQTLAPLHTAARNFSAVLSDIEARQAATEARHRELNGLLERLEAGLASNAKVTQRNLSSLQARYEALTSDTSRS